MERAVGRTLTPVDYLVIGHVTRDILPDGRVSTGGTVSYASLTAAALQRAIGILTSAGADFDPGLSLGVAQIVTCPSPVTTTFENLYVNGHREQRVHAIAQRLDAACIPECWRAAPLVHVGPVINECDGTLVDHFAGRGFLGLTPQGWLRMPDSDGRVQAGGWHRAAQDVAAASAVVLSIEDLAGDWEMAEWLASLAAVLVVTTGPQGGVLFDHGVAVPFPAPQVTEVDPTGAGDVFAASFFIAVSGGAPPATAAHFATCLAARSVTRVGLSGVPTPEEVAACSTILSGGARL